MGSLKPFLPLTYQIRRCSPVRFASHPLQCKKFTVYDPVIGTPEPRNPAKLLYLLD